MFGLKFLKIWVIFGHLKLWIAVARRNFKWMKIPGLKIMTDKKIMFGPGAERNTDVNGDLLDLQFINSISRW